MIYGRVFVAYFYKKLAPIFYLRWWKTSKGGEKWYHSLCFGKNGVCEVWGGFLCLMNFFFQSCYKTPHAAAFILFLTEENSRTSSTPVIPIKNVQSAAGHVNWITGQTMLNFWRSKAHCKSQNAFKWQQYIHTYFLLFKLSNSTKTFCTWWGNVKYWKLSLFSTQNSFSLGWKDSRWKKTFTCWKQLFKFSWISSTDEKRFCVWLLWSANP